jgi:hypothetical protein
MYTLKITAETTQGKSIEIIPNLSADLLELVKADRKADEWPGGSYTYNVISKY